MDRTKDINALGLAYHASNVAHGKALDTYNDAVTAYNKVFHTFKHTSNAYHEALDKINKEKDNKNG